MKASKILSVHSVYDAIVSYSASEQLQGDAWGELVKALAQGAPGQHEQLVDEGEKAFRDACPGVPMPGAWRSAKSVALGAIKYGIPLMQDNEVRGKSEVQTAINAAKGGETKEKAEKVCPHCGHVI